MKNKKGFTLVEVLAVISVLGLIMIVTLPTIINSMSKSKNMINDFKKDEIINAAKLYISDIDNDIIEYYNNTGSTIDVNNNKYEVDELVKPYDLRCYLKDHYLNLKLQELIDHEYYSCEGNGCANPNNCIVKIKIESELSKDKKFLISTKYIVELGDNC